MPQDCLYLPEAVFVVSQVPSALDVAPPVLLAAVADLQVFWRADVRSPGLAVAVFDLRELAVASVQPLYLVTEIALFPGLLVGTVGFPAPVAGYPASQHPLLLAVSRLVQTL